MNAPENKQSPASLLGDALGHVSALVRKEVDLARAEVNENLHKAGVAIGMIVAAGIIALVALNVLAAALVAALAEIMDGGWAALIVGVIFAVIAAVLLKKGTNDLKLSSLAPSRTAKNIQRDAEAVKESTNAH